MAGGMEMMLTSLIKAVGFNPEELQKTAQGFATEIFTKIAEFDVRMSAQETRIDELATDIRELTRVNVALLKTLTEIAANVRQPKSHEPGNGAEYIPRGNGETVFNGHGFGADKASG